MASFLDAPQAYINFAVGLRAYLKTTADENDIKQFIQQQIANREETFLETLKTNVFEHPRSPYYALFKHANITFADVTNMVSEQGLEQVLEDLYEAGIYTTFEEFKGRAPIVRGSLTLTPDPSDFDCVNLTPVMFGRTGGSTGKPSRTKLDLANLAQIGKHFGLGESIHGVFDSPKMAWFGILPDNTGVGTVLRWAHTGHSVDRWFSSFRGQDINFSRYYHLLTYLMIGMGRIHGFKFPMPEYAPLDHPLEIAQALANTVKQSGSAVLRSTASKCVRVALVAKQHHIDLTGVTFYGGAEPSTPAKVATIELSGARYITHYGATEVGTIGLACANPADENDVHFMKNHLAMIVRPKEIFDQTVDALHITSLLPTASKMLINVQLDDFVTVEERDCGCPLHQLGLTQHIRNIGSYRKLTAEGVTLVGSDMVHILEHVLPTQFGGSLLDYQLVEEETAEGFTRLLLYVAPSVGDVDNVTLEEALLNAMNDSMPSARLARAEFKTGHVISVRREKPFVTNRGKHLPIRTLKLNQ